MNKKRPKKSTLKKLAPTPGPYGIREKAGGCEVYGKDEIEIAWFGENGHYNLRDSTKSHLISKEEAHTNANLLLSTLVATESIAAFVEKERKRCQSEVKSSLVSPVEGLAGERLKHGSRRKKKT